MGAQRGNDRDLNVGSVEKPQQSGGAVLTEQEPVIPVGLRRKLGAPQKQGMFVLGQRCFDVVGLGGNGPAQLSTVEHGQVGSFAGEG